MTTLRIIDPSQGIDQVADLRRFIFFTLVFLFPAMSAEAEQPKEIFIKANALAPAELRANKPTPGKWWLQNDILSTGRITGAKGSGGEWQVTPADRFVAYRVPGLVIDPKVSGWHRIYFGLVHEPVDPHARILARLSKEPYSEYLQAPERSPGKTAEVLWKAADLTGQKIHLEQPPAPMQHPGMGWYAGITHVRLAPITKDEVAAARKEIELPPRERRLFGMLDYTDEIFWWGTVESEDDIRAVVYRHREAGFGRIYWRSYGSHLDHSLRVPEAAPRWTEADEKRWCARQKCQAGWMPYINLTKKFDPFKVAVEYGAKNDIEVHGWVRFTNHNREPYANFWHANQDKVAQMLVTAKNPQTGKVEPVKPYQRRPYLRVLSLAYPEVRAYYVKFFREIAASGTRGILIDLLRHPPIAGYEPIVADAFKKKYGMDMETRDVYHDPLVQEHLSEYLRLFLVDLRKAVGKDIEIGVRSSGPEKFALRGKEWIAAGLIDTLIDGNWYSGNGPRPTLATSVAAAGTRGRAFAIIEPSDVDPKKGWARRPGNLSDEALAAFTEHYRGKGLARMGLYESTVYTWYPDLRRAVRAAGWRFSSP